MSQEVEESVSAKALPLGRMMSFRGNTLTVKKFYVLFIPVNGKNQTILIQYWKTRENSPEEKPFFLYNAGT